MNKENIQKLMIFCLCIGVVLSNTIGISSGKDDLEKIDDKLKYLSDIVSVPEMEVWGTEYISGEDGKIWLQLLDSSSQPINDSTCFIKTWFPNNTIMFNESQMYYLDSGIHAKDFTVPNYDGVYPQTAMCSVPSLIPNISDYYIQLAYDDLETGDGNGGTGWVTDWGFDDNGRCSVSSLTSPIDDYHIRCIGNDGIAFRISKPSFVQEANISFWAKFTSLESGEYYYFEIYNETEWKTIKTWDNTDDDGIYRYYEYHITGCISGILFRFRANTGGTGDYGTFDNITVSAPEVLGYNEINDTAYQYIFGSGEIHVSNTQSEDLNDLWEYIVLQDSASLESNHDYCQDNETLLKVLTYSKSINGNVYEFQENITIPCDYGCYNYFNTANSQGYCSPSPVESVTPIMIFVASCFGAIFIAFYKRN